MITVRCCRCVADRGKERSSACSAPMRGQDTLLLFDQVSRAAGQRRISLDGHDIPACRCTAGDSRLVIYRRNTIFRGMTVAQNIMACWNCGTEPEARQQRLGSCLEEFGLTRLRNASAMALSGGERRRCESPARSPPTLDRPAR